MSREEEKDNEDHSLRSPSLELTNAERDKILAELLEQLKQQQQELVALKTAAAATAAQIVPTKDSALDVEDTQSALMQNKSTTSNTTLLEKAKDHPVLTSLGRVAVEKFNKEYTFYHLSSVGNMLTPVGRQLCLAMDIVQDFLYTYQGLDDRKGSLTDCSLDTQVKYALTTTKAPFKPSQIEDGHVRRFIDVVLTKVRRLKGSVDMAKTICAVLRERYAFFDKQKKDTGIRVDQQISVSNIHTNICKELGIDQSKPASMQQKLHTDYLALPQADQWMVEAVVKGRDPMKYSLISTTAWNSEFANKPGPISFLEILGAAKDFAARIEEKAAANTEDHEWFIVKDRTQSIFIEKQSSGEGVGKGGLKRQFHPDQPEPAEVQQPRKFNKFRKTQHVQAVSQTSDTKAEDTLVAQVATAPTKGVYTSGGKPLKYDDSLRGETGAVLHLNKQLTKELCCGNADHYAAYRSKTSGWILCSKLPAAKVEEAKHLSLAKIAKKKV